MTRLFIILGLVICSTSLLGQTAELEGTYTMYLKPCGEKGKKYSLSFQCFPNNQLLLTYTGQGEIKLGAGELIFMNNTATIKPSCTEDLLIVDGYLDEHYIVFFKKRAILLRTCDGKTKRYRLYHEKD